MQATAHAAAHSVQIVLFIPVNNPFVRPTSAEATAEEEEAPEEEQAEEEEAEEEQAAAEEEELLLGYCWASSEPTWPPLLLLFAERKHRCKSSPSITTRCVWFYLSLGKLVQRLVRGVSG